MPEQRITVPVKIEQEYENSRIHRDTVVVAEETVLSPTCITNHTGATTLFLRRYRLLRLPSNRLVVRFRTDIENPRNGAALTAFVDGLAEMPEDQPGDDYLPDQIRAAFSTGSQGEGDR